MNQISKRAILEAARAVPAAAAVAAARRIILRQAMNVSAALVVLPDKA